MNEGSKNYIGIVLKIYEIIMNKLEQDDLSIETRLILDELKRTIIHEINLNKNINDVE